MGIGNRLPQHQSFLHLILQRVSIYQSSARSIPTPSLSSARHWSYPLIATKNIKALTFSKQWIHFFRSDRCPPTSNIRYCKEPKSKTVSVMPVVRSRARRTSWSVGTNSLLNKRSRSMKKLQVDLLDPPRLIALIRLTSSNYRAMHIHFLSLSPFECRDPSTCL